MNSVFRSRRSRAPAALAAALVLALSAGTADARAGKSSGSGFGSRGSRTYDAPATTQTAPNTAAPIDRSVTAPSQAGQMQPGFNQPRPGMAQPASGGFFDGLGSLAGILGFAFQAVLIFFLVRLAIRFFQNRSGKPAYAGAPAAPGAQPYQRTAQPQPTLQDIPAAGAGAAAGAASRRPGASPDEIGIVESDYREFEQLLGAVQAAYGQEDLGALRQAATPEMVSYLSEELADNAGHGIVNKVSDVRLLQGDLAEAWSEGGREYATVAMRFSLVDCTVDRATGRVVEGSADKPVEATEVWTFMRPSGGRWLVSAIQKT